MSEESVNTNMNRLKGWLVCLIPFVVVTIYIFMAAPKVDLSNLDKLITVTPSTETSSIMSFYDGNIYYND